MTYHAWMWPVRAVGAPRLIAILNTLGVRVPDQQQAVKYCAGVMHRAHIRSLRDWRIRHSLSIFQVHFYLYDASWCRLAHRMWQNSAGASRIIFSLRSHTRSGSDHKILHWQYGSISRRSGCNGGHSRQCRRASIQNARHNRRRRCMVPNYFQRLWRLVCLSRGGLFRNDNGLHDHY